MITLLTADLNSSEVDFENHNLRFLPHDINMYSYYMGIILWFRH
jgi:hypothetical protein